MTVTLQLPPEIEQGLLLLAQSRGVSLDQYVEVLLRQQVAAVPAEPDPDSSADEWFRKFRSWVESNAGNTVVLPDAAMERDSIYGAHGQ